MARQRVKNLGFVTQQTFQQFFELICCRADY